MATRLFVGNLPYSATDDQLQQHFAQAGNVVSANVVTDRQTGRSRGFGFVEMGSEEDAQNAVNTLNGSDMDGRAIVVSEARAREERAPRQGGFRGNRD